MKKYLAFRDMTVGGKFVKAGAVIEDMPERILLRNIRVGKIVVVDDDSQPQEAKAKKKSKSAEVS